MSDLASPQAERAIIGTLLSQPTRIQEVITELRSEQFGSPACAMLFAEVHAAFFADRPIDAVSISGKLARNLREVWGMGEEAEAVERVANLSAEFALANTPLREHAALVRRYAERRELIRMSEIVRVAAEKDEMDPSQIAATISQRALTLVSGAGIISEIVNFGDAGRAFLRTLTFEMEATKAGVPLGAKTKIQAIDEYTRGRRPGRLYFVAGEPGVGKSAVEWVGALNFATEQAKRPANERVGTLILSMEMGDHDSSTRFAQHLGKLDGEFIQDANVSAVEFERIVREWGQRKGIPLYLNYAPNLRTSQMLAIIAEAIRRHNVGYVVVDHFRTFDLDRRLDNVTDEDEEKARFLKEEIARTFNVAVVCLAHTRKPDPQRSGGRPYMADLRGSGQISAHADMVSFIYRPIVYAHQDAIDSGEVSETDAEMIHRKNRQGPLGTGKLYFDPSTMTIH